MSKKLTRRDWAAAAAGSAALAPLAAQAPDRQNEDTPEQLLEAAHRQVERNRELLAKFKIEMATEPAFQFKA